jgi:hypothetical protein
LLYYIFTIVSLLPCEFHDSKNFDCYSLLFPRTWSMFYHHLLNEWINEWMIEKVRCGQILFKRAQKCDFTLQFPSPSTRKAVCTSPAPRGCHIEEGLVREWS